MQLQNMPIVVRGAREHNLQNVEIALPRNRLICFTGVSGSGKSSLAFDTIFAEGQRRYLESLSNYARQFIGQLPKPDVDFLSGLSPSIAISQKATGNNPRSTVGTMTEINDFLRVLYARVGQGYCPECNVPITAQTRDQIIARLMNMATEMSITTQSIFVIMAPIVRSQKGEFKDLFDDLRKQGFNRARVDGQIYTLSDVPHLEKQVKHSIEVVIDRLSIQTSGRQRVAEAVDTAIRIGQGSMIVALAAGPSADGSRAISSGPADTETLKKPRGKSKKVDSQEQSIEYVYSADYACPQCGVSYSPPSPQLLSFNSPQGMCLPCNGLGELYTFDPDVLFPDPKKSIRNGACVLLGGWSKFTKLQRKQLQAVSTVIERKLKIEKGNAMKLAWGKLPEAARQMWLYGLGEQSIHYSVGRGRRASIESERYPGMIASLISAWNRFRNPMQKLQYEKYMHQLHCGVCNGQRLNAQARHVKLERRFARSKKTLHLSLPEVGALPLAESLEFFENLVLTDLQKQIATEALKEICSRIRFLIEVGLGYLTLDRPAPSLSGGESQRIRLASQIGSGLVGVTYVLDEPSIGLHPRDNDKLLSALKRLRNLGNTVLVVEHDEDTMNAADLIVDFGPGPGVRGGKLLVQGNASEVAEHPESLTGKYLSGRSVVGQAGCAIQKRRTGSGKVLRLEGVQHNNLKNVSVDFPLGTLICVTGVSGSGKSSLVTDILTPLLRHDLNGADDRPTGFKNIHGIEHLDKIIDIDQSPIGRTPRSNPATYVKVFDEIRDLYAQLPESKKRGYLPGRFSFNTEGGRCSACEGNGSTRLDMEMLADLWVTCPLCNGRRYDFETLQVLFKGKSIADCLDMDIQEALEHFSAFPKIAEKLQTLHDVGLDYLKLGQPSPTLSGGEAQRIKLSKELSRRATGRTLYVLDEPTTGLHFHDISLLLGVLQSLVEKGNTVVVVEHNLDLIQAADWIIDLGPEGGAGGGKIISCGTPEDVIKDPISFTGVALEKYLSSAREKQSRLSGVAKKKTSKAKSRAVSSVSDAPPTFMTKIEVTGASMHNLQEVNLAIDHGAMTVFCGKSGSGKTSLAIDTIYAEGQRRYVESLSSYARQFVGQMPKPTVSQVAGLAPAVALEQRSLGHTPRSTVGTVTEIYDYLRVFMARLAVMHCPQCQDPIGTQTVDQIVERIMSMPAGTRGVVLAPINDSDNGESILPDQTYFEWLQSQGFVRVRIDGVTTTIDELPDLNEKGRYKIEVAVDRIVIQSKDRTRITDSIESALALGKGVVRFAIHRDNVPEEEWETQTHSLSLACNRCGISFRPLSPHSFSFNTHAGWCEDCHGLGVRQGTNPAALMDVTKTLLEGGLQLWPNMSNPMTQSMLTSYCNTLGIPMDRPIVSLSSLHKGYLLFGNGAHVFQVGENEHHRKFSFKYRGIYPTLDVAARSNVMLRMRLDSFTAEVECMTCRGSRVRPEAANSRYRGRTISELVSMPLEDLHSTINSWKLDKRESKIADEIKREVLSRLSFLIEVGLGYLTIGRAANSLSGGEAQRIRLAGQLGSGLCGVLYVLDEPTIGLHPRDNYRLVSALKRLRDLGNTLIVVEHDRDVIASSDGLCDFGPGSGVEGGRVVAQGTPAEVGEISTSVTGPYLSGRKAIPVPSNRRMKNVESGDLAKQQWLGIRGARSNTLRNVDVDIPLGTFVAITGPSGSGKSTLINDCLYPALARRLHRAQVKEGLYKSIEGIVNIDKVVRVDQSPLGSSPSSTPATYTGAYEGIRELFAKLPDSQVRGFTARQFSFNVPGGRCEKCEGNGQCRIEMHFLPDVWVECDACHGKRFTEETLEVHFKNKNIFDVLNMKIGTARELFENHPKTERILRTLCDVGLDYVALGQPAPTLSGGEAQRVKLAAELSRPTTGRTLYLLDEPTTGLHFDDIAKLLNVLQLLVDMGNTVVVIEHNLDVIKSADWVIEMGPEAGWDGGQLVFAGTPEQMVEYSQMNGSTEKKSIGKSTTKSRTPSGGRKKTKVVSVEPEVGLLRCHTGEVLKQLLEAGPYLPRI